MLARLFMDLQQNYLLIIRIYFLLVYKQIIRLTICSILQVCMYLLDSSSCSAPGLYIRGWHPHLPRCPATTVRVRTLHVHNVVLPLQRILYHRHHPAQSRQHRFVRHQPQSAVYHRGCHFLGRVLSRKLLFPG